MNAVSPLRTNVAVDGTTLIATLQGSAESDVFEQLSSFIGELQGQAARSGAKRVVADLRTLEFATSSCLKVLSVWVMAVAQSEQYTVEFLSSPQHSWQRRSLQALAACAPEVVQVRTS